MIDNKTGANEFKLVYKIGFNDNEPITEYKRFMSSDDARIYLQNKSSRINIISIENLELNTRPILVVGNKVEVRKESKPRACISSRRK